DEGSGFDIARQATRAIVRAEEGWGPPTCLRELLLESTGAATADEMLHLFYTDAWPRSLVAKLARIVDAAATDSDAVAVDILNNAAQQLAVLAGAVRTQLWPDGGAVEVAYIGGVFESVTLRTRFQALVELSDGVQCGPP